MTQIGPFFYIRGKLIYNACSLVEGREQAGKLDNPYGHDQLYDDHFKSGEYIDYPRGRVLWDEQKNRSIIYIDPCIHRDTVLSQIIEAFDIGNYLVEYDDHYHCKKMRKRFIQLNKNNEQSCKNMRLCFVMHQI